MKSGAGPQDALRRLPARGLIALAIAATMPGVHCDAWAYGGHREKSGEGVLIRRTQGLPDLERGEQAVSDGRLQDAEADLKPLAERGYADAQIALAKLYAHVGSPERVNEAIGWLRSARLSDPLDTAVPLGRLLARQNDDASIAEGEALLATAWEQRHDTDALAGLIGLYGTHPELDDDHRVEGLIAQADRIELPDVQSAVIGWYRSTRGVGGHAEKLAALCTRWVDQVPECYVDLSRDARISGDQEYLNKLVAEAGGKYDDGIVRPDTLASLARVLVAPLEDSTVDDDDLPAPAIKISDVTEDEAELSDATLQAREAQQPQRGCARVTLTPASDTHTGGGSSPAGGATQPSGPPALPDLANALLARMLNGADNAPVLAAGVVTRYPYLLPGTDIEAPLKAGAEYGDPQAKLYLGQLYLVGARAMRDPKRALQYLQQAADDPATALKGHYSLGRLYAEGYLDESRPLLAAQYLMWSARRGYAAADGALARLYVNGKGMCPNLTNAYVFAKLGARGGSASTAVLERQVAAQLPATQIAQADALYAAELQARPSAYQIPDTMLAQAGGHQDASQYRDGTGGETPDVEAVAVTGKASNLDAPAPAVGSTESTDDHGRPVAATVAAADAAEAKAEDHGFAVDLAADPAPDLASASASGAAPVPRVTDDANVAPERSPLPAVQHEVQLSHRPLSDPAVQRLLGISAPSAASPPPASQTIEYTELLQVPDAPRADVAPHAGDPS
jgi:TPR repeat protein